MVGALYRESDKRDGMILNQTIIQNISLCQIRFIFMLLIDFPMMIFFAFIAIFITVAKSYSLKNDDMSQTHPQYCMQQNYVFTTIPFPNLQIAFKSLQSKNGENILEPPSIDAVVEEGGSIYEQQEDLEDIQAMFRKAKAKASGEPLLVQVA